jgi:RNA polymerase sigma-70 factor (ECF subfamily)
VIVTVAPNPCLKPRMAPQLTVWVGIGDCFGDPTASRMVDPSQKLLEGSAAVPAAPRGSVGGVHDLDEVMDRYAAGTDAAFDELYRRGAHRVRGFLIRLAGDAALADDLTQETFVRIHRARGSFSAGAAALPWMFAIARNAFVDHARREQVRRSSRAKVAQPREASPETRGDEAFAGREMLAVVRATLERLPLLQREAFVLLRFEGLSVSEAAQILGATEAAVKVRAFRAYEALRAALEEASAEPARSKR